MEDKYTDLVSVVEEEQKRHYLKYVNIYVIMLGLYEKTKLGITRKIPKLKIFSFIIQLGFDINNWTHHMGRMEPNLLPRRI